MSIFQFLKTIKAHQFFLITAFLFGGIFLFLVPPFQAPDEVGHYYKAYHITEGYLLGETLNDNRLGGHLPKSIFKITEPLRYLRHNPSAKVHRDSFEKMSQLLLQKNKLVFTDFPNIAFHAPTAYWSQSLVIFIAKQFASKPLTLFYLGRIAAFFSWLFFVYWAIRIIPFHKWTYTLLALLPSSLFINSSLSSDPITNGFAFFFIAYCLFLIFEYKETIKKRQLFILLLFSSLISLNKLFYAPLVLFVFLIPNTHFPSMAKKWMARISIVLVNFGIVLFWYIKTGQSFIPYDLYDPLYREPLSFAPDVAPKEQMQYILAHPLHFIKLIISSLWEYKMTLVAHSYGKFGWGKNYLPTIIIGTLTLLSIAIGVAEQGKKYQLKNKHRFFFIFIFISSMILICTVLYLVWSPYQHTLIMDIQGRYFFPVLPLLFISLKNKRIKMHQQKLIVFLQIIIVCSLLVAVYSALERFYI